MACGGNNSEEDFTLDEDDENSFENLEEKENKKFLGGIHLQHFPSDNKNSSLGTSDMGTVKRDNIKLPEFTKFKTFLTKISKFIDNQLSTAQFVSLLNDYVESEFFLIDGDSLLLTCLSDQTLKEGQNLQFFYLIERLLLDLTEKGAKYELIFFKDAKHLYFHCPDILSLRTALIMHLDINTDIEVHAQFSNFLSPSWREFLRKRHPYFLFVSNEGIHRYHTQFLQLFMIHALANKINVVLTEGQESDTVRVYGFHIQSKYEHQCFVWRHEKSMKSFCQALAEYAQNSYNTALCSLSEHLSLKNMRKKVQKEISRLKDLWPKGSDVRRILCAITCSLGLKMYSEVLEKKQGNGDGLTLEEAADLCRMYCLSVVLLLVLPLSLRAQSRIVCSCWKKRASTFIQILKRCECVILDNIKNIPRWKVDLTYLSDLNDNLLWMNIAYCYEKEYCAGLKFGKQIDEEYQHLWNTVFKLVGKCEIGQSFPLRETSTPFLNVNQIPFQEPQKVPSIGLIKVQSDLVDDYATDVLKDLPILQSNDPAVLSLVKRKSFDELKHWHSRRPLKHDIIRCNFYGEPKDPRIIEKYQKLKAYYQFYGQTLEGNISTTITAQKDKSKDLPTAGKKAQAPHECSFVSKTIWDTFAEQNKKGLKAKEGENELQEWTEISSSIEKDITKNLTFGINRLESYLKTCQNNSRKLIAEMMGLDACFGVWIEHCRKQGDQSKDLTIAVQMMRRVHNILGKYQELLVTGEQKVIAKYLKYLGFKNLACSLDPTQIKGNDSKKFAKFSVGMGAARFQLQYMGHYLLREERSDPDPRVKHFIPDTWQRELLDAVDNNESAVIVAPTSSGKTYASYYCMEKVLKESNEGVVVYVAPTKALVNQVVATVYNRFTKPLPKGLVVCGSFTRDYRNDTLNCQILVTVPQCLEILLLSPHQQEWVKRIRYVIFDEVHCLGGEIGAEVWEHLLVMIRCPFLALSATISNPEHLTEWLQSVKEYWQQVDSTIESVASTMATQRGAKKHERLKGKKKSYKVRLVLYDKRYNDLEKFLCSLEDGTFSIEKYHPCAALSVNHIKKYGIPSDLTFSPQESLQLYDTMVESWQACPRLRALDPEEFGSFKDNAVITKNNATKYQEELKKELKYRIEQGNVKKVENVVKRLRPFHVCSSEKEKQEYFPLFVEKLREMDKLPALFFLFNIKTVEKLAENVCSYLQQKQEIYQMQLSLMEENKLASKEKKVEDSTECGQSGSTDNSVEEMSDTGFSVKKTRKRQKSKSRELDATKQPPGKTHENVHSKATDETLLGELEKIAEMFPDCTYANCKALSEETLKKVFERATVVRNSTILKTLAMRGIGYHHASLEPEGRQTVEMLFRMGFVKVVNATGSLALGINMPCKSVVFTEDSIYLDALNYRQMSGRAGRRGQDMTGNVFFYDIPLPKVERLIKANVPELKGQFPLSISLVLRLMVLTAKADDKEDAKAKALSVLKYSLLSFKKPKYMEMLKLYFLFSLQFLVQEEYLDKKGDPMGFAGLISHLHYHEPANFILVSFLLKGLFHKMLQTKEKDQWEFSEAQMEIIVLVLANIFGQRYLPPSLMERKQSFRYSEVFLENLPEDFAAAVNEYNSKIEVIFGCFLLTVSKMADMENEYHLPLSKLEFAGRRFDDSELVTHLMSCKENRTSVSPFACLSGNMDHDLFHAENVNSIMLRTIGMDAKNIPVLWLEKFDCRGKKKILNAYALDFYRHGSLKAIADENKIHEGEAYNMLRDFYLLIRSVSISMMELCENKRDSVLLAFDLLSRNYRAKLEKSQDEYTNTDLPE
ncbi:probable ATP-dependent RNA helicase DDX60 [Microcaecilia unicolor]|uniref:Probable ATP-dependent RNA helicase DDX60 n=1 Tax=Microcaecilia unicolor TaxID=1415580 RepID=A0A6P7X6J9_9AMPH|nr:probable ATP-dependent RNA helicase DDX60 [Microcaecilia unicolor]